MAIGPRPRPSALDLETRLQSAEAALAHARQIAEAERRRADAAEASARRAWEIATWGGARGQRDAGPC